jgi:PilZ domain
MANSHSDPPGRNEKTGSDRRRTHRFPATAIPGFKTVHLGTGPEVELVNISRGGALVESTSRLTPSSNISLRLVAGESSFVIRGRVLRSQVAGFLGCMLRYRSAIQFTQEFVLLPEIESPVVDDEAPSVPQSADDPTPESPLVLTSAPPAIELGESAEADPTFTAYCASYDELETLLRANNW